MSLSDSMGRKSISNSTYRYDANFLYPTSYIYDLTNTKADTKEEISVKSMNLKSKASKNMP